MGEYGVKQRPQVLARHFPVGRGRAVAAGGEDDGAVELFVGGVQFQKQFQRLVHHLGAARVGAVGLVDDDDDLEVQLQRLFEYEARLRHRPLEGVYQQKHAADHLEYALHLAGKVGVAGGIDDVDAHALVVYGGVLGKNGDAALALQIVGIHHALGHLLVFAEHAALLEHLVHQRGLAVVHVGDDGDVANVVSYDVHG